MRCNPCPGTRTRLLSPAVTIAIFATILVARAEARDATLLFLDMEDARAHTVQRNGVTIATPNSSSSGIVTTTSPIQSGDQFVVYASGGAAVPPQAPTGLAASGDDVGCALITWDANPEGDIAYYRVYWGPASGTLIDSLDVGTLGRTVCGLADGDWYFRIRAANTAGLLSAMSIEVSASVSTGSAQPPLPPQFVNAVEGASGCMTVAWFPSSDPTVVGYVVEYGSASVAQGEVTQYEHSLDVTNGTFVDICGLTPGTYYVAVRSRNYLDMVSAPSQEMAVTIVALAVLINNFQVRSEDFGVHMEWSITADENIRGYRVLRERAGDPASQVAVNPGLLLAPSARRLVDTRVEGDTEYTYLLVVVGEDGSETRSAPRTIRTSPLALHLEQNVPNPFNPTTSISFVLPSAGPVRLIVYDARGAFVSEILGSDMPAGRSTVYWDGTDGRGHRVASGAYFYRLVSGAGVVSRKMILLK